ncbi:MAG: tyrosine-protein phosphatase [Treponema sp.]|uniref:tyrosine-protein phosphatase n=1 Tax=Treponema sp. TaxID=166 RepID=UPI00298EBDDF|nr:tyrosine-protein phosphatase [Treponema sp.]MDD5811418.1 tyrosine-protein phosphatase [Treponema sp.]
MKIIKLKSTRNYRDIGNIPLKDGTTLPTGKYIRGKTLYKVAEEDIKTLVEKYHLKTIIDLRTNKELLEKPNPEISGVKIFHMPIFDENKAGVSRDKKSISLDSLKNSPPMVEVYKSMADGDGSKNIKNILETILSLKEDQLPVLFHCTAGKDRTGVIAALLLKYFGASEKDILKDYLYTNHETGIKPYILCPTFFLVFWSLRLTLKLDDVFKARKEYLKGFMEELEKNVGPIDKFLEGLEVKK